jgi:hypothetical protein
VADSAENGEVAVIADQTMNPNLADAKEITSEPKQVNAGGEVIAGECREPNEREAKQPNSAHMDVASQQGASVPSPADTINANGVVKKDTCAGPSHMGSPKRSSWFGCYEQTRECFGRVPNSCICTS